MDRHRHADIQKHRQRSHIRRCIYTCGFCDTFFIHDRWLRMPPLAFSPLAAGNSISQAWTDLGHWAAKEQRRPQIFASKRRRPLRCLWWARWDYRYYSFWICSKQVACKTNGQQVVDLFGVEWVLTCQEYGFQATPLDDVLAACVDFFEDSCVPQINHGTFWHLQSLRPCRFLSGKVSWRSQESGLEVAIRSGCLCVEVAGSFIQLSQSRAVEWLKMKSCFCDWCLIPRNRFFLPIFSRCFWEAD